MSYYSTTLQKGSKGDEVKKWQEYLNTQGYGLSVDGDFGTNTYNATIDYQTKNGLGVDGIVGAKTWAKAGFSNVNTPVSAPTATTLPTYTPNDTTPYGGTVIGQDKDGNDITDKQARNDAYNAIGGYGDPTWSRQEEYGDKVDEYLGRGPFSYDFNADALYQQYKDMYMQQGKMAMQDTMGQAAAMTGGYGNSYAATAGNQSYQQYLGKLNEVIPELYQLALSKYNQEGQDMLNAIGLLENDRAMYLEDWQRGYDKLLDGYNLADGMYQDNSSEYYTNLANKNNASDKEFDAALAIADRETEQAWNQAKWDETQRLNELDRAAAITTGSGGSSGGGSGSGSGGGKKVMYDDSGNVKEGYTTTNTAYFDDDGNFKKATFSKYDDDGNAVWYIDGKTVVRQKGANPYTGTINPDLLNRRGKYDPDNAFSATPYQPNNINGQKLSKSGIKDFVNGVEQNVWKTPDGKLWIWDGTQNKYLSYTE